MATASALIRVNREELLAKLHSVQAGLSKGEVVQQSHSFVFENGWVMTYNDEVAVRAKSRLDKKFKGAVRADPLLKLLSKMTEEDIELEDGGVELVVHGAKRRAGVQMEAEVLLGIAVVEDPKDWHELPEDFDEALTLVAPSASGNKKRFTITCIHLTPKFIEACDNVQLTRYKLKMPGIADHCLVKRDSLAPVAALGMTEYAETEAWLHFRNANGLNFSCRRYAETYPDLNEVLEFEGEPLVLPGGLGEAVEKAEIFSSDNTDDNKVLVEMRKGGLRIKGEGQGGWYQEVKQTKYNGPSMQFLIAPKVLVELCKAHNECAITPAKLKVDGGKFVYIGCLFAPDDPAAKPTEKKEE